MEAVALSYEPERFLGIFQLSGDNDQPPGSYSVSDVAQVHSGDEIRLRIADRKMDTGKLIIEVALS